MEKKWFLMNEGQISGPYHKEEVEQKAAGLNSPLIWGRGHGEWASPARWQKMILENLEAEKNNKKINDRQWRVRDAGQELEAMSHDQMMDYLKSKNDLSTILIWTEGYSEWKEVYQIHKIMDELGVSRRTHPRVPIMGSLQCEGASGTFQARVLSISEGGLGMTETPTLKIGEKLKLILKSANLFGPLHATGEVVYVGADNYAGVRFIGLHPESKSAIVEYVNKFLASQS